MRIAILSDIHGNNTAFEAVLRDLSDTKPDLILHGGDLVDGGSSPVDVLDQIKDLRWPGVLGNADEIYTRHESLDEFASQSSAPPSLWAAVREMAAFTRKIMGENRIAWLRSLPRIHEHDSISLVHATPGDLWRAPAENANDSDLADAYAPLGKDLVVYAHIHRPFVRTIASAGPTFKVANTGSVGLPFDGDPRTSYLLIDDGNPTIRHVEYNLDRELRELSASKLPHADWIGKMLKTAASQLP